MVKASLRALYGIKKRRVSTTTIVRVGPYYHYTAYHTTWFFPSEKRGTQKGQRGVIQRAADGIISPSPYHVP